MDEAIFRVDEEFVEDEGVRLLAQTPEHHQNNDLEIFNAIS